MNSPAPTPTPPSTPAKSRPPLPLIVVGLALLIGGGFLGGRLWWRSQHLVETDNAFLAGHVHPVSTRVAGVVTEMHLQDNASVKAGDVLLKLDAADADVQVERLKAQLAQAQAQVAGSGAQLAQLKAQVAAAQGWSRNLKANWPAPRPMPSASRPCSRPSCAAPRARSWTPPWPRVTAPALT
jgi:membrane fusion protein (multidrug efflux system)